MSGRAGLTTRTPRHRWAVIGGLLGGLALVGGLATPGGASHGVLVGGVVVEFLGLRTVDGAKGAGSCVVGGAVHNGSDQPVMVRVTYRGYDATGAVVAFAHARLTGVQPQERREFASSSFAAAGQPDAYACSALRKVDMVEAVASPSP